MFAEVCLVVQLITLERGTVRISVLVMVYIWPSSGPIEAVTNIYKQSPSLKFFFHSLKSIFCCEIEKLFIHHLFIV